MPRGPRPGDTMRENACIGIVLIVAVVVCVFLRAADIDARRQREQAKEKAAPAQHSTATEVNKPERIERAIQFQHYYDFHLLLAYERVNLGNTLLHRPRHWLEWLFIGRFEYYADNRAGRGPTHPWWAATAIAVSVAHEPNARWWLRVPNPVGE